MRSRLVIAVFVLVCAIFGTTFLAIKIGVAAGAPSFLFAGLRFVAAGLILGAILLATGRASPASLAALAPRAVLLSLPYVVVNFGAMFWAEQYIDSSTAAQLDTASPIAAALLSALFLGKKLRLAHGAGVLAGFAGVWLVVRGAALSAAPLAESAVGGADGTAVLASVVLVLGAIGFAGATVLYKRLFDDSVDSFSVNSINMLSGGSILLVIAALTGQTRFPATPETLGALAYLIVAGSLVGHSANLWLVRKAGPLFTSSWTYVTPVIATAVGALALGERVSVWSVAGAALTLLGVWLIARVEMRSSPRPEPRPAVAAAGVPLP